MPTHMEDERGAAHVIEGKGLSDSILQNIRARLEGLELRPCLAVVTVGQRRDGVSFVRSKMREAAVCGVDVRVKTFPATISENDLLEQVALLNSDPSVDGILLALPLPSHLHELTISQAVSDEKDVDCLNKQNLGLLAIPQATPLFVPCTAVSVVRILESMGVKVKGKVVCVVGASANVGLPLLLLLVRMGATVTVCHVHTRDLVKHTLAADIIVSAAGVANLIQSQHVRDNEVIVIDVGINFVEDKTKSTGFRLTGDVDFETVKHKCGAITPVPGGVGVVTSAVVLEATAEAFLRFRAKRRNTGGTESRPKLELVYPQNSK